MLIVFDSKSSLIHYTFDKTKFLSQLHICIVLLYLIFYFSKFMVPGNLGRFNDTEIESKIDIFQKWLCAKQK
jgi:hypothetical protein